MVRSDKIIGKMYELGLNRTIIADKLGMTRKTFSMKLEKGIFNSDEMEKLIDILELEDPMTIFFPNYVAYSVTKG